MKNTTARNNYLKYIAIALVIVFLVSAALFLLALWENRQGKFPETGNEDGIIEYNGKEYVPRDNIETFLVLGLDKYDGQDSSDSHESGVQADFLMLFVFNNETKQATAIHINRDTITKVNKLAIGGTAVVETYMRQIALAYNYVDDDNDKIRCRNTKDSVEYLLNGIKVDHYLSLTMDAVSASCDLVGGVEVTVLDDFTGIDDTLVKGETVNLTGEQALRYVRSRYGLEDSTNTNRMKRQQQYLNALYDKTVSLIEADNEFILKLVDTMDEYVVYDSSDKKMQKYAEKFKEYEFLGIKEIDGEAKRGEEFMEFYSNEESIKKLVVELFYIPKNNESK
ncbi:MAG: LCP family protein [Clostridia bacterium]|nr:LCP family protein [Clostridia bacterium]